MMKKYVFRIIISLMCLYVFIAKTYAVFCFFSRHKCDYSILFADLVVLCACVFLIFFFWGKSMNIKYTLVWNLILLGSVIMQLYSSLFNFLTKNPMVDQNMILWAYDVPNLLSVSLLVITMVKMRGHRKDSLKKSQ
jgi:hypothetical protein